jgi:hypothetical protein
MRELTLEEMAMVTGGVTGSHIPDANWNQGGDTSQNFNELTVNLYRLSDDTLYGVFYSGGNWDFSNYEIDVDSDVTIFIASDNSFAVGYQVNWSVIEKLEGGIKTKGYTINNSNKSGVTVGAGVDLGQHSLAELQKLGIDKATLNAVAPYLGKTGIDAINFLKDHPLDLTRQQAQNLTFALQSDILKTVAQNFDRDSNVDFKNLPSEIQTAIASVAFQYGPYLAKSAPNFWSFVTSGNYFGAVNELRHFNDVHQNRHDDEADYFMKGISKTLSQVDIDVGEIVITM